MQGEQLHHRRGVSWGGGAATCICASSGLRHKLIGKKKRKEKNLKTALEKGPPLPLHAEVSMSVRVHKFHVQHLFFGLFAILFLWKKKTTVPVVCHVADITWRCSCRCAGPLRRPYKYGNLASKSFLKLTGSTLFVSFFFQGGCFKNSRSPPAENKYGHNDFFSIHFLKNW